jgi:hypothetical protein
MDFHPVAYQKGMDLLCGPVRSVAELTAAVKHCRTRLFTCVTPLLRYDLTDVTAIRHTVSLRP